MDGTDICIQTAENSADDSVPNEDIASIIRSLNRLQKKIDSDHRNGNGTGTGKTSIILVSCPFGLYSTDIHAVDVVLGAQWGDEGKGKLVDILSQTYGVCARVAGGSNAGHTIVVDVRSRGFRTICNSSASRERSTNFI